MAFQVWDYLCTNEECEKTVWESVVKKENADNQVCSECEQAAKKLPANPVGWLPSKDRTSNQLQRRSLDHAKWCKKTGTNPSDTGPASNSFDADPVWRNKKRAKNTSRETINQFRNVHKTWVPGKEVIK